MNNVFYVVMYFIDGREEITEYDTLKDAEEYISDYDDIFCYCEIVIGNCLKRIFYEEK